jgi:F-type H+-transporting ATPase subunit delta
MAKISRRQIAETATRQLVAGKDPRRVMLEVAAYLVDNRIASQADMVIEDIAARLQAETGHTTATVRAAFALSPDTLTKLEAYIKEATKSKSVELTTVVDPALLGGVVIQTPGYEYDASVRRKLNELARGEV